MNSRVIFCAMLLGTLPFAVVAGTVMDSKGMDAPPAETEIAPLPTEPKQSVILKEVKKEKTSVPPISEKDWRIVQQVEKYLNDITTIITEFTQVAPDGSITTGKLYLERPGRMRWEYDPPTPVLMVTSGMFLTFYDSELQQVSNIPLDSTLAGFLAKEEIRLDDPAVKLESVEHKAGVIRIHLSQRKDPEQGKLMLEFKETPMLLKNMVLTDATGQVTTVSLNNARFGAKIDRKQFIFVDPRKKRRH